MNRYRVWERDYGDRWDGNYVTADSPADAAEKWCANLDRRLADYPAERIVTVQSGDGALQHFRVELQSEPVYHALPEVETP